MSEISGNTAVSAVDAREVAWRAAMRRIDLKDIWDDPGALRERIAALESERDAARDEAARLRALLKAVKTLAEYLHAAKANPAVYGARKYVGVEAGWHDAAGRVLNILAATPPAAG